MRAGWTNAAIVAGVMVALVCTSVVCGERTEWNRGVASSQLDVYEGARESGMFQCLDGSGSVTFERVNDDYCDCEDGSDEPGTSACNNAQFTCVNKGYRSKSIPSGHVNDGICDCCDGSDEYDGSVTCKDTCVEAGAEARAAFEAKLAAYKAGVTVREQWAQEGKKALAEKQSRLEELQVKKSELEQDRTSKEEEKKRKESAEELEREARKTAWELEQAQKKAEEEAKAAEEGNVPEEQEVVTNEDTNDETAESKEEEEEEEEQAPTYTDPGASEKEGGKQGLANVLFKPLGAVRDAVLGLVQSLFPTEAEQARKAVEAVEGELKSVTSEIDELNKVLGMDFGADSEFYPLYDVCVDLTTREYRYELCPFKSTRQASSNIGTWGSWTQKYTEMKYANGDSCWQGPVRSTTVKLTCGANNAILAVSEPAKCTYAMEFATPAMCTQDELARLQAKMDAGDIFEE